VTVCDPRQQYRDTWNLPGVTLVREMPDDAVVAFAPTARSCIIALTHDPKLDDLALLEALRSSAFYVGAIGSRRNNEARRERLATYFDMTDIELSRLHGPVGLYIGSKTPPEIAVSIMAEVLAVKNGVCLPEGIQVGFAKNKRERPGGD
jgi:xanthine dehydrogenase accessory factor